MKYRVVLALAVHATLLSAGGLEFQDEIPLSLCRPQMESLREGYDYGNQAVEIWMSEEGLQTCGGDLATDLFWHYLQEERQNHIVHRVDVFSRCGSDGSFLAAVVDVSISRLFVYAGADSPVFSVSKLGESSAGEWVDRYDSTIGVYRVDFAVDSGQLDSVLYLYPGRGEMLGGVIRPGRMFQFFDGPVLQVWRIDEEKSSHFVVVCEVVNHEQKLENDTQGGASYSVVEVPLGSEKYVKSIELRNQTEIEDLLSECVDVIAREGGIEVYRSPGLRRSKALSRGAQATSINE